MKYRSPAWVLATVIFTGGLLGLYWPYKISGEYLAANASVIAAERLRELAAARSQYRSMAVFHLVFWLAQIFIAVALELPRRPELFDAVISIAMLEVLLLYFFLVRLIFTFEQQFQDIGHRPKLWLTLCLTLLWFASVSAMQKLANRAIGRQS